MQEQRLIQAIITQAFEDLSIDIVKKCKIKGNSLCERLIYRNWAINFFNDNDFKWLIEKVDIDYTDCSKSIKSKLEDSNQEYMDVLNKIRIEKDIKDLPLLSGIIMNCK